MSDDSLLKELEDFLAANPDTRFMDVFAADMAGVPRGKRIQREDFKKVFDKGANYCAASTIMNVRGEAPDCVTYGAHDGDPDVRSVAVSGSLSAVPWARQPTAQVLVEVQEFDGTPCFLDSRAVLRKVLKKFEELELTIVMATEMEFYLYEYDGDTFVPRVPRIPGSDLDQTGTHFAGFEDLDDVEEFLERLDSYCQAQNLPAGAALSEYSPGQFEINLQHVASPELACDQGMLLKRAIKAAARKSGLNATFMAKPFAEHAGCGLHMHISLLDKDGNNIFSGESADGEFSDKLRHAIGGMKASMEESMAIFAPNANSYRRYSPGFYVAATPNWGPNHRDLSMRIPVSSQKNRRVEHRIAGADANPYLTVATVLAGMHYGLVNECDPGPMVPEKADIEYKQTLPTRWSDSLRIFQEGKILPEYLGEEYHRVYGVVKQEEFDEYNAMIPDLDYDWFLRSV